MNLLRLKPNFRLHFMSFNYLEYVLNNIITHASCKFLVSSLKGCSKSPRATTDFRKQSFTNCCISNWVQTYLLELSMNCNFFSLSGSMKLISWQKSSSRCSKPWSNLYIITRIDDCTTFECQLSTRWTLVKMIKLVFSDTFCKLWMMVDELQLLTNYSITQQIDEKVCLYFTRCFLRIFSKNLIICMLWL